MKNIKELHNFIIAENINEVYKSLSTSDNYMILRGELCETVGDDPENSLFGVRVYTVCIRDIFEALQQNNHNGAFERVEELYYNILYGQVGIDIDSLSLTNEETKLNETFVELMVSHRSLSMRSAHEPTKFMKNIPKFGGYKYVDPVTKKIVGEETQMVFETKTDKLPTPSFDELNYLNQEFSKIHWQWQYSKLKEENGIMSVWGNMYHPVKFG